MIGWFLREAFGSGHRSLRMRFAGCNWYNKNRDAGRRKQTRENIGGMSKNEPELQSIAAKRAESQRPYTFNGQAIVDDPRLGGMYRAKAQATLADLKDLSRKGVLFSPFLEIGAGSVQRSAALINNYPAEGAATDISQKSLLTAPYILAVLKYDRAPMLISCDCHHIPFLPNTFQFVFAYRSLHHFNNPAPVLAECYRILAKGGHLFFNEEPMDSSLRRRLRGKRLLTKPPTPMQKLAQRFGLEKVFWDDGKMERSLGMTSARFGIELWRTALAPYRIVDMEVNSRLKMHSDLNQPAAPAFLSSFVGGNVRGLCVKKDGEAAQGDFRERLMCLDCSTAMLSPMSEAGITCHNCQRNYPVAEGVIRMLPRQLEAELYPGATTGMW